MRAGCGSSAAPGQVEANTLYGWRHLGALKVEAGAETVRAQQEADALEELQVIVQVQTAMEVELGHSTQIRLVHALCSHGTVPVEGAVGDQPDRLQPFELAHALPIIVKNHTPARVQPNRILQVQVECKWLSGFEDVGLEVEKEGW